MSANQFHFIIIDDSIFDSRIAEKVIQNVDSGAVVTIFHDATKAFDFLKELPHLSHAMQKRVLFVDIQMPIMNGFEFVESFETLPDEIKSGYILYFITSSMNENDIRRGTSYPSVRQFLNKPLTVDMLSGIITGLRDEAQPELQ
jgi:CheY-like chemotaxis protein